MLPELVHSNGLQRVVHSGGGSPREGPQVLRSKGHILFHHVGYDLVIRVLEHHAHRTADGQEKLLVGGVHPVHIDLAPVGRRIELKCLARVDLPLPLCPSTATKEPSSMLRETPVQHDGSHALGSDIGEADVLRMDDRIFHNKTTFEGVGVRN